MKGPTRRPGLALLLSPKGPLGGSILADRACPKWRVDILKIVLGLKLQDPTRKQREEVLDILWGI
jgi:hypothetical protein